MLILGLSDGSCPGAALLVDDADPLWEPGPTWSAAERALARAGAQREDVGLVALAGRFTPPWSVRRRGGRRGGPFGARMRLAASWERVLRTTGLGAYDADRAREWLEGELAARGYRPRRVTLVDLHQCLASAAYRSQPADEALVAAILPRGDGAFAALHRGHAGAMERVAIDAGSSAVHLWFDRAVAASGWSGPPTEVLAAPDAPDAELARGLADTFRCDADGFFARRLELRQAWPWSALPRLPAGVAAATVGHVFRDAAFAWLERGVRRFPATDLALGGLLAADPQLVARATGLPGVRRVWAGPWTGASGAAAGAAMAAAGRAPTWIARPELPVDPPPDGLGEVVDPERVAELLAEGVVARYGDASFGPDHVGPELLIRADHGEALARTRPLTGDRGPAGVLALEGAWAVDSADALFGPLRHGTVAPVVRDDRGPRGARVRWAGAGVAGVLERLRASTGCGAVAVVPLPVDAPGEGVAKARAAGAGAVLVGETWRGLA